MDLTRRIAPPEPDQRIDGALLLPCDFARTATTGRVLDRYEFELAVRSVGEVDAAQLLVAVFAISLHRYSGQASIPLEVTLANATRSLQLTTAGVTCGALVHQIAEQLRAGTRATGNGPAAITWGVAPKATTADLHLIATEHGATFVFNTKLFKRTTIARLAGHLQVLVASVATRLDAPIAQLTLLPAAERDWLDAIAHGRTRAIPDELVHQRIEQHAARAPDAIALRHRDGHLTYGQLNRRANQLAHLLGARQIGAEQRIAVCVEPSFDILIALLGILKAGAVYVPIDPTYPVARIRAILDDIQPALIISRADLIERLGLGELPTLALDSDELDRWPADDLAAAIDPRCTAYVYYTSGTTGRPKGVMASQLNLAAYLEVARERYAMTDRDVMPAIARFSFSISMFELLAPLVAGGTLVILDRDHVLDLARMAQTLSEVTFFHAGPSLLKHLVPYLERLPDRGRFTKVRHASSGGDMIAPELLEALKRIFTAAEVFVIYGCSEISCVGCTYPVPRDTPVTRTYVGRPFDNVIVRVLDAAFEPVPIGVVGEIHFGGGGVVKGYLNRPELTAEKFVEVDGERLYRTGDMGRMSDDGWLEILGRNDFQIKVRGMRIELGEVEYNLRRAPDVRDAVVMAKDAAGGDKIMVGYVVGGEAAEPDRRAWMLAIRRHMVEHVPDYMVPAVFVELASLPLNHNMKIDRHALPELEHADARPTSPTRRREPETPTEQRLAVIWQQNLGVPQVGLDDNCFELGADSLLAMELGVRAEHELGVAIDGMDLLRESLEVIAAICDRHLGTTVVKPQRAKPVARGAVEIFHFGPNKSLYGVLHGAAPAREAVLVCAPIGPERVRAHFVLSRLARMLAARGTPVLLYDPYGLGDSAGDSIDATLARWQQDLLDARAELVRRTGATRVVALGARFGAAVLCSVVGALDVSRVVLWDPIYRGSELLAGHARLHRRYLRGMQHLRKLRRPDRVAGGAQLLGLTYSDAMRRELRRLAITWIGDIPVGCLATYEVARQLAQVRAICGAACQTATIEADVGWHDISRLEDMGPDLGIAQRLATLLEGA